MKTNPHKTERIHSLDSLRAIMMLLGLVLHSATTYSIFNFGDAWPIKDPNTTHASLDFIVFFIHLFRMQIFFVVAGFFGAMLFYERSPLKMLKNRISRVVLPFIVFILLLSPIIFFSFSYCSFIFMGNDSNKAFENATISFSNLDIFFPKNTFHLWFLYYLTFITLITAGLGLLLKKLPKVSNKITEIFNWIIQKPAIRVFAFGSISALIYFMLGTSQVATSSSIIPDFNTYIYYSYFYLVGWVLFKSKQFLNNLMQFDWMNVILGIVLFFTYAKTKSLINYELTVILKSLMVWLFIFGFTGLFIRYASKHSSKMRYISDASYWIYLIHLPLTAIIPSFINDWPIAAIIKFLIVLVATNTVCFITYHYLVRATFIGQFLNGRKYSNKLSK